jgi:hypothetical protein
MHNMSRKPQSKDEAIETLDFIVNVLKEHEKDLDKLINELGTVTENLGNTGELSRKVETVEEKINGLQGEVANLITYLSKQKEIPVVAQPFVGKEQPVSKPAMTAPAPFQASPAMGPPVILRCKQWEDFMNLAQNAHTLSFIPKEAERSFQADALKGNQIITYSGELPKLNALLKMWLSKQLTISEMQILEGVLTIG